MLILLIIPIVYRYLSHSLHYFYATQIQLSDQRLTIRLQTLYNNELVFTTISPHPTHYYIQETTLERLKIRDNDHVFRITLSKIYMQENPNTDWEVAFTRFENMFSFYSKIYNILYIYTTLKKSYSLFINMLMISLYLICWSYVLYTGTYMLSNDSLI
jgi:hypothetical protein